MDRGAARSTASASSDSKSGLPRRDQLDMRDARDVMRRELLEPRALVLPDRPLPLVEPECEQAVREELARGEPLDSPDRPQLRPVPEGARESLVVIQNELAIERGAAEWLLAAHLAAAGFDERRGAAAQVRRPAPDRHRASSRGRHPPDAARGLQERRPRQAASGCRAAARAAGRRGGGGRGSPARRCRRGPEAHLHDLRPARRDAPPGARGLPVRQEGSRSSCRSSTATRPRSASTTRRASRTCDGVLDLLRRGQRALAAAQAARDPEEPPAFGRTKPIAVKVDPGRPARTTRRRSASAPTRRSSSPSWAAFDPAAAEASFTRRSLAES